MCRNIKLLYNFEPPATEDEIRLAAVQYVRKVSGMRKPTKGNADAFERAIEEITAITCRLLLEELETATPPRDRETEKERAVERGRKREAQLRKRYGGDET